MTIECKGEEGLFWGELVDISVINRVGTLKLEQVYGDACTFRPAELDLSV